MQPTGTALVSIITPTFNHERFIGPCIQSVLDQTYAHWEQIIIDDGSTDQTAKIVGKYSDARVRYRHQEHRGIEALAHSYNRALELCRGELIAILEGDDLWPPNKLASLVPAFDDATVVLAYGAVGDVAADGTWHGALSHSVGKRRRLPGEVLHNDPPGTATRYMLRADGTDLVPPSAVVIRRSALVSVGGFQYVPDLCVTDYPTFLSLSLAGKFHYTPEVMGYRRRHLASTTFNNSSRIVTNARRYADQFIKERSFPLSATDREAINRAWRHSGAGLQFTAGRLQLTTREWREARRHFQKALDPSNPRISFASALGWVFSWLHLDLEGLVRLLKGADLREKAELER